MALDPDAIPAELPGLLRYARYLTGDAAAAEDLVQDTVERALRGASTFAEGSSVRTWLHRIMHHRFVDLTRARAAIPVEDEVLAESVERNWRDDAYTVDPEVVLERTAVRDDLRDALVHVPWGLRAAVVLHDVEGLKSREVAEVLGVSLPAAKARLLRGRALLLDILSAGADRPSITPGVPLRCWEARSRIGDYLDDELPDSDRATLERHLKGCPTCPGLYRSVVGLVDALGELHDPDSVVPAPLADRLRSLTSPGRSDER